MRHALEFGHEELQVFATSLVADGDACPLFAQPVASADKLDAADGAVRAEFYVYAWLAERGHMVDGRPQSEEAAAIASRARSVFGGMRSGVKAAERTTRYVALVPVGWEVLQDLELTPWVPS